MAGWKSLLRNPAFVDAIGHVNFFVASHHGRENGCCAELFSQTRLRPAVVAISNFGIEFATQNTVAWYRVRTRGIMLNGEQRHVLTTRRDGRICDRGNSLEHDGVHWCITNSISEAVWLDHGLNKGSKGNQHVTGSLIREARP